MAVIRQRDILGRMTEGTLDLRDPGQPFKQVARKIRAAIASGEFAVGDRLPSVRSLAESYGVSDGVIQRAQDVLRDEGLINSHPGRATYVIATPAAATTTGDSSISEVLLARLDRLDNRIDRLEQRLVDHLTANTPRDPDAAD